MGLGLDSSSGLVARRRRAVLYETQKCEAMASAGRSSIEYAWRTSS